MKRRKNTWKEEMNMNKRYLPAKFLEKKFAGEMIKGRIRMRGWQFNNSNFALEQLP